jgi:hypothetical protein
MVRRMARIVTYAHRSKRAPRKKPKAAPLTLPRIVRAPTNGERAQRREEAERPPMSPEEEARVMDLLRRMMRPR